MNEIIRKNKSTSYNPNLFYISSIDIPCHIYDQACFAPLGVENNAISDGQISASSQADDDRAANQARLHAKISSGKSGGWAALKNNVNQWLQVDLGTYTRVTRVATQGRNSFSGWVTKCMLQYSDDGFIFRSYEEAANTSAMVILCLRA